MKNKILLLLFCVFPVTEVFSAEKVYGRVLKSLPINLSLSKIEDINSIQLMQQLGDTLLRYNGNSISPGIAKSWKLHAGAKKYSFKLRKDLRFSDGSKIITKDVLYLFETMLQEKSVLEKELHIIKGAKEFSEKKSPKVKGIKIINDYEFEITLTEAYPPFIYLLASTQMSILNKKGLDILEREKIAKFPTSGAYEIAKISKKEIILTKNKNYYDVKNVYFDKIKYYIESDQDKVVKLLEGQKIYDIWPFDYNGKNLEKYNLKKVNTYSPVSWYILFNLNNKSVKNLNLRKYLRQNFDNTEYISKVGLPARYRAYGFIPRGFLGYISPQKKIEEEIVQESQLPCSIKKKCNVEIKTPYGNVAAIKAGFKSLENSKVVRISYKSMKRHEWYKEFTKKKYEMTFVGNNANNPDTFNIVKYLKFEKYHPGLKRERINRLLVKASSEMNRITRAQYYYEVEKELFNQAGIIPVYHGYKPFTVMNKKVKGVKLSVLGFSVLKIKDLYLSEKK